MIVPSTDNHSVSVEIYKVDSSTLAKLDELEAPYRFHRETTFLAELDQEVELYVYDEPTPPSDFRLVESGEWNL